MKRFEEPYLSIWQVVYMGRTGALCECVVAGVGEVVAVGVSLCGLWNCL